VGTALHNFCIVAHLISLCRQLVSRAVGTIISKKKKKGAEGQRTAIINARFLLTVKKVSKTSNE